MPNKDPQKRKEYNQEYQKAHRGENNARQREYYKNMTPEQRERKRERQYRNAKRYYQKNPKKYRQQAKNRRAQMTPEERERLREYRREYNKEHREELNYQRMIWKRKRAGTDITRPKKIELPWAQSEIDILLTNYPNMKLKDLALLLPGRTIPAILNMAKDVGIRRKDKINHFNEHFFDVPNLLNSYWAGFIAADGNVLNAPNNKLGIILKYGDKEHIERFARDIEYDGGFIDRYRHHSRPNSPTYRQFGIQLNHASVLIAALRENFNITPKKSLTLIPPNITDPELCRAYIVGFIDGDGSVCVSNRDRRLCLASIGTASILQWVKKILSEIVDIGNISVVQRGKICSIAVAGKRAELIVKELSRMDVPKLDRKWTAAQAKMISRLPSP